MSKFVTYGVTEMLDNDQKFIIDSDRTGPGSITAKDAASSLLSKWAGFETFEEAVQNTISNNQEFIDRDTAIRSETAELKKKIVTTFPAKDASGAVATFESEFEDAPLKSCIVQIEPVQDLHGYDSPWPAGGGKNLLDLSNNTLPYQGQGITIVQNGNVYTITANGATGYPFARIGLLHGLKAGEYVLSCNKSEGLTTSNSTLRITNRNASSVAVYNNAFILQSDIVDDLFIELAFTGSALQDGTYTISNCQLELGSTATTYSPYSNICPITGWTGCEIYQADDTALPPISQWVQGFVSTNGNITGGGGERAERSTDFIPVKPSKNYTFKYTLPDGFDSEPWTAAGLYNSNKNFINRISRNRTEINFTTTAETAYIRASLRTWNVTVRNLLLVSDELRIYPITFPTEAGTVYGGYVDVTGGELVVDRAMVDLGTFNPSVRYVGDVNKSISITLPKTYISYGAFRGFACSTYAVKGGVSSASDLRAPDDKDVGIYRYANITKPETKTVYFVMPKDLALSGELVFFTIEPQTYPLTPTEIKTLLDTNNIWSNTGDTAVEYLMSDVSWYVEKKLRAFQSILAGVEDSTSASKNYSANTYLIFNNDIYRVTKAITAGETIEEGVNVTKTTVAEQLMALAQA